MSEERCQGDLTLFSIMRRSRFLFDKIRPLKQRKGRLIMAEKQVMLTEEGLKKLEEKLEHLKNVRSTKV